MTDLHSADAAASNAGKRLLAKLNREPPIGVLLPEDVAAIEAEAIANYLLASEDGAMGRFIAEKAVAAERERIAAAVEAMDALEDEDLGVEMWWVIRDDVLAIVRGEP